MLYVVATPIGNLDDITLRALEVLKSVDVIAAEDTRHSGNLLRHFEIRKPLVSYHEHNEAMRSAELVERLAAGENVALITDAGMPGLSDPGARLIRKCIERGLAYTVVPGVSAILTPATPSAAFGIGEKGADPIEMYLNDIFTVTVNMAGLPGIAVPAGKDGQGLPLGLQLIGRPFDEETLFSLGEVVEQAAGRFTPPRWW